MTREELEKSREILSEASEGSKQSKLNLLAIDNDDDSLEVGNARMLGILNFQLEELLDTNSGILAELRYMNDKGDEVNNG